MIKMLQNVNIRFIVLCIIMLSMFGISTVVLADNAVKLKVLVIATGDATHDMGLAYIKPVLDEMGVPYDVMNATTDDLVPEKLASINEAACNAVDIGCVGNYNGIILTLSDLTPNFTPNEWDVLHNYEKDFKVREAVLMGWPAKYWDPNPPYGVYLDYGLSFSSSGKNYNGIWSIPTAFQKEVFEYINKTNTIPITDFAFTTVPSQPISDTNIGPRDGTIPTVTPLLKTGNGEEALVSIIQYMHPSQSLPVRQVLMSTITHASFLIHSKVIAYEFINWATQGVFVGARFIHMSAHLDDLFLENELWDPNLKQTTEQQIYRLTDNDIYNAVAKQSIFRLTHPTANGFKLDFPFNGAGAVIDPNAAILLPNYFDGLVLSVMLNSTEFRYINHTYQHKVLDSPPVPATASCDYETYTTVSQIQQQITKNRNVWDLLGLPERTANNRVLVTGNHSGLKDNKCTIDPARHPEMFNVQSDDIPFPEGTNPLLLKAAANAGVSYMASDSSQLNQNVEQYITTVDDGKPNSNRLILPRWPTNIFFNVTTPNLLTDEYNYIFHDRFVNAGQDPCVIPGAICSARTYSEILSAEADNALRHMLTFNKWPHFFHQSNLAKYDNDGNTLQFDWLNSVFTEYEKLLNLPVKNLPYYMIGDKTRDRLTAKSANIQATWNRSTNLVTLSADKTVPNLEITGVAGGEIYGGQRIRKVTINTTPVSLNVNRMLTQ